MICASGPVNLPSLMARGHGNAVPLHVRLQCAGTAMPCPYTCGCDARARQCRAPTRVVAMRGHGSVVPHTMTRAAGCAARLWRRRVALEHGDIALLGAALDADTWGAVPAAALDAIEPQPLRLGHHHIVRCRAPILRIVDRQGGMPVVDEAVVERW